MTWKNNADATRRHPYKNPGDHHRADITRPRELRRGSRRIFAASRMIVTRNCCVNRATYVCTLALLLCLVSRASGEYESREMSNGGSSDRSLGKDYGSCTDGKCIKRTTQEITSGMWFGPRLGRRRRSDEKPEMSPKTIEALANVLDGARWTVIKFPGRGSGEELLLYDASMDRSDEDDYPFYASRAERRLPWTPSPRLGRQLHTVLRNI